MPSSISSTIPEAKKTQILHALVAASFILHSGGKGIIDFAKALFGDAKVNPAVEERKEDEYSVGMNGGIGEGGACTSLARAYALLTEAGEDENAAVLKSLALGRFTSDHFAGEVSKVRAGG